MIVEDFSRKVISSNVINVYVATAFFATLIFFVLNANSYTPLEMIIGVGIVTIAFKGISNVMLSLVISLFSLKPKEEAVEFDKSASKVNNLLHELSLQQAKLNANKHTEE